MRIGGLCDSFWGRDQEDGEISSKISSLGRHNKSLEHIGRGAYGIIISGG